MKTEKQEAAQKEPLRQRVDNLIKAKVNPINSRFNALSLKAKQAIVFFFGMSMAMFCVVVVVHALQSKIYDTIPIEEITFPNDIYMNNNDTTKQLIPVGKLKGEIDGEFEAFYVAVDDKGQPHINRNPSFGASRFVKSQEWQPITRQQLESYEKQLHFIPHKSRGLKP